MIKRLVFGFSVCCLLYSSALAQTFDGQTPAEEEVCDSLNGAAYGLCVAYCEAQDCDVNLDQPSCPVLRKNFEKKTGSSILPCDARCGDGIVNQPSEQCDDGNALACDGCSSECTPQFLGEPGCEGGISECIPQSCGMFSNCNLGSSCGFQGVCGTLHNGSGKCIDGAIECANLSPCNPDGSCNGEGELCFVNSCCGPAVCIPSDRFCSEGLGGEGPLG